MNKIINAYFKKIVSYQYRGKNLKFKVSQSLFSSYDIDTGTRRLLRSLTPEGFRNHRKVLDLGCGYGPIGIALKSVNKSSMVHMVDKDALALEYSRLNASLNKIKDVNIYGSLGYDDVKETDFDLIVSNIPAKVGEPILSHLLHDGKYHLRPSGHMAIVVIETLVDFIAAELSDPSINILFHKKWPGHHIYHYKYAVHETPDKPKKNALEEEKYNRGKVKVFSSGGLRLSIQPTYNLPEFNTLSFDTELVIDNLHVLENVNVERAIVFNPGQGFIPVALSKLTKPKKIVLIDRNLQALRISKKNLVLNKYPSENISTLHQLGINHSSGGKYDCLIGILDEKESPKLYSILLEEAVSLITNKRLIIFASSSRVVTRLEKLVRSNKHLKILKRKRFKGKRILIAKNKS